MTRHKWLMPTGAGAVALACVALASGPSYAARHVTTNGRAHAARVVPVTGKATLRVTHERGNIHEAQGPATGTLGGTLMLRIDIESASRMSASYTDHLHGGTLTGTSVAHYTISGANLHFTGTSSVTHGTGAYAGASGSGIHIEGTLNRIKKTLTMSIHGSMHLAH